MINQNTLISLAILKEQINNNEDYLSFFNPFVISILKHLDLSIPINDELISNKLKSDCGLKFPARIVQLMLKKITKKGILCKNNGVYIIQPEKLSKHEDVLAKTGEIKSKLSDLISNYIIFCKKNFSIDISEDDGLDAFVQFLSKFSVSAIRLSISGTAFDVPKKNKEVNLIYVSQYVLNIFKTDSSRFEEFEILLKGNMIANSIVSETLIDTPQTFKDVVFYLDTPVLVELYGLDGNILQESAKEMVDLVTKIGGKFAVFEHTKDETVSLINRAAEQYDIPESRLNNKILENLQETGLTKSDLQLKAEKFSEFLNSFKISIVEDPEVMAAYCIDENHLSKLMDDHVGIYNFKAKQQDIKSVQNIYQLRKGHSCNRLEECKAVFVTNNSNLASAIHEYGRTMFDENQVSAVITDFSLANMAWLKAPFGSCNLQKIELLAMSYLSLQPSNELLQKYLSEIEKLQKEELLSDSDYLLLTCQIDNSELLKYTLGREESLSRESILSLLERIKSEIKEEENQNLKNEKEAHTKTKKELEITKEDLNKSKSDYNQVIESVYWNAKQYAKNVINLIKFFTSFTIFISLIPQIPHIPNISSKLIKSRFISFIISFLSQLNGWIWFIITCLSVISLITGTCIFKWFNKLEKPLENKYIHKQEKKLRITILK